MKFAIATVAYWDSIGFDTTNWRKSLDGRRAICHLDYAKKLGTNLYNNPEVKIYDSIDPELKKELGTGAWIPDGTAGDLDIHDFLDKLRDLEDKMNNDLNTKMSKVENDLTNSTTYLEQKIDANKQIASDATGLVDQKTEKNKQDISEVNTQLQDYKDSNDTDKLALTTQLQQTEQELNAQLAQTDNEITVARDGAPTLSDRLARDFDNLSGRIGYLTYDMFKTPGISDDKVIKNTHDAANALGVPVVSHSGEYWLDGSEQITIKTNVEWGSTVFHINESTTTEPNFIIPALGDETNILSEIDTTTLIPKLKKGSSQTLSELAGYSNHIVFLKDSASQVGARYGFSGASSKIDFLVVESGGKAICDLSWDFDNLTEVLVKPIEEVPLTINGGSFLLSGEDHPDYTNTYVYKGFAVTRSKVTIQNQYVGIEPGNLDLTMDAAYGFYRFDRCYKAALRNVRVVPRVSRRPGQPSVPHGTYGITCGFVIGFLLDGVDAEASGAYWGVMGSNYVKDMYIYNSNINRVDVHYQARNITIRDSRITRVAINGGGLLLIDNTSFTARVPVTFREDFGGTWDGDIRMNNITHYVLDDGDTSYPRLVHFATHNFDYKHPIVLGNSIHITDLRVDYTESAEDRPYYLVVFPEFSQITSTNQRLIFPYDYQVINASAIGRNLDAKLLHLPEANNFLTNRAGSYNASTQTLVPNSRILFENVGSHITRTPPNNNYAPILILGSSKADEYSLVPEIEVRNCGTTSVRIEGIHTSLKVRDTTINALDFYGGGGNYIRAHFDSCTFKPDFAHTTGTQYAYIISDSVYTNKFITCVFDVPLVNGIVPTTLANLKSVYLTVFDVVVDSVSFLHVGSMLSPSLIALYKSLGATPSQAFYNKLMTNNTYGK